MVIWSIKTCVVAGDFLFCNVVSFLMSARFFLRVKSVSVSVYVIKISFNLKTLLLVRITVVLVVIGANQRLNLLTSTNFNRTF